MLSNSFTQESPMKEPTDLSQLKLEITIQRDINYRAVPASGFSISETTDKQIVIELFTDLPPLINATDVLGKPKAVRQIDRCYFLTQTKAKLLMESLQNFLNEKPSVKEEKK